MASFIAYLAILLSVCAVVTLAQDASSAGGTISFVIDPFDRVNEKTRIELHKEKGYMNLSLSDDALFGGHSLRVDYGAQRTESWGGFTAFSLISPGKRTYNCMGATHLSFWYKVAEPSSLPGHVHLRVVLMDDSDCERDCEDELDHELYYSFHHVLDETDAEWHEVRVELAGGNNNSFPFWRTGWAGQEGNGELDLDRIAGYYIEMSIDASEGMNEIGRGAVLIDQLACVGGGELFGAALLGHTSMVTAAEEYQWYGDVSSRRSRAIFDDGALVWNYTIEQSRSWGTFVRISHAAPEAAYYNLSQASSILLDYKVIEPAKPAGRATLRLALNDSKNCTTNCHSYQNGEVETFYSFHDVLDEPESREGTIEVHLDHEAQSFTTVSNIFTGISGNGVLDLDHIKGFRFEIDVDSNVGVSSTVTGSIAFKNLRALVLHAEEEIENRTEPEPENSSCAMEPGVALRAVGGQSSSFRSKEFRSTSCCEACEEDDDCLYAVSNDLHCWVASELAPEDIILTVDPTLRTYWNVKSGSRGDFCDVCDCRVEDHMIDCRGKNLTVMPQTISIEGHWNGPTPWTPLILDLRDNPRLVFIGSGTFSHINDSLEEVHFPANLTYLSPEGLKNLPSLRVVTFEGQEQETYVPDPGQTKIGGLPTNVISSDSDFYGDVCCHQGYHLQTTFPVGGLSFCELDAAGLPGSDAVYEEFVEYFRPDSLIAKLTPKSTFMSEAAESAEKCAEYCNVINSCKYFSYDARYKSTEHTCYLSEDNGTIHDACCNDDDYADSNKTLPGWISGRVPRARREVDNARVLIEGDDLQADANNGYTQSFGVSLGSSPIRGAVWVEPTLVADTDVQVVISPPRVALYDNGTIVTVKIQVLNPQQIRSTQTVEIANKIHACDAAFTSASAAVLAAETSVFVMIEKAPGLFDQLPWILIPIVCVVMLGLILVFYYKRRDAEDTVWKVKMEDVELDPITLLGEGSFGSILLAEYKGTQIAVKPVLPLREDIILDSEKTLLRTFGQMATNALRIEPSVYSEMQDERNYQRRESLDTALESGLFRKSVSTRSHDSSYDMALRKGSVASVGCCASLRRRKKYARLKGEFVREMRHLSKLRHPCLTTIMGAVVERTEVPFIMLEFMEHGSLYDLLHNETMTIDGEFILPVLRDIVSGVRFLHATQPEIIHGNIRAQNVLLDLKFRAKVTGFGFSQKEHLGISHRPWWTSPEVLRGETEKTKESDVYAYGMTLYEIFSRKDPFDGENGSSVLPLIMDPAVTKRPPIPSGCPPEIQSMISDCLNGVPELRPTFEKLEITLRELHHSNITPADTRSSVRGGADRLMFDVFPPHIAEALRDGREVEAELRDTVTIFFSDIVGFTQISSELPPIKIADMLDRLYTKFDRLSDRHDVFKVETIGDAYMAVTNLVKDQPTDHAKRLAEFATDVVSAASRTLVDRDHPEKGYLKIRVGLHSGSVVADVVGSKSHRPRYCLFGDTVNTASRMESNSKENRIHCSEVTAHLLASQCPDMPICHRGAIPVKGKGKMHTYWVNEAGGTGLRPGWKSSRSLAFRGSTRDLGESVSVSTFGHSRRSFRSEAEHDDKILDASLSSDRGGKRRKRRLSLKTSRGVLADVKEFEGV